MDFYWPVTINMSLRERFSTSNASGLNNDLEKSKKQLRALGFCTNALCFGRPQRNVTGRHFVDGVVGLVYKATGDQSKSSCPNCDHALFWSKNYEYLTNKECKARKIRTIAQIYDNMKSH